MAAAAFGFAPAVVTTGAVSGRGAACALRARLPTRRAGRHAEVVGVRMAATAEEDAKKGAMMTRVVRKMQDAAKRVAVTAAVLATVIVLSGVDPSAAAQTGGGRVGGSNFRSSPPQSRSVPAAPSAQYAPPPVIVAPTPYSPFSPFGGGMFFSPMIVPLGGGGSFFTLMLFLAFAAFLFNSVQSRSMDSELEDAFDPPVQLTTVKVGMLSTAEELKRDLERMGRFADTSTSRGLHQALQDTVLALVRNPDYWVYGSTTGARTGRMSAIENEFEEASMAERVKLREETLSNVNSVQRNKPDSPFTMRNEGLPSEFIVVSLIVAAGGNGLAEMPAQINSAEDMRRALLALGSVSSENLQALEIIWAPQGQGESLSRAEMLLDHPELRSL
uniref:DUF1517 domain-containing protein n=1 Tax=Erythrolobus australicus TaxID=1077150 RepID=A0A7S1TLM2_9RHOD